MDWGSEHVKQYEPVARPDELCVAVRSRLRGASLALLASLMVSSGALTSSPTLAQEGALEKAQKYLDEQEYSSALIEAKNAVQAHPNDPQARILLGKIYLRVGDPKSAEAAFVRARELGASDDELDLMLAYARLGQGSFEAVVSGTAMSGSQATPMQRDLMAARGDALLALEKLDEAQEAYDRVLSSGSHAMALRGKATIALMRRQPDESRKLLDQALALEPENDEIVTADAEWFLRQGKYELARDRFAKAIELNPMKLIPRIGHVRAVLGAGDTQNALQEITELRQLQPNSMLVVFQDSVVQLAAGNYKAAKSAADQVLARDQYHTMAMNVAGSSAYALGLYEQAAARLRTYVEAMPQDKQARILLAASLLRLKEATTAKTILQPLLADNDARVLALMGTAEALSGNNEAAVQYMDKASALTPDDQALRSQLGMVRIAAGDPKTGVAELQQVLQLDRKSGEGAGDEIDAREISLVVGQLRISDYAGALENLARLQNENPENARLYVLAGIAHMGLGEKDLAEAAFSRAVELDPMAADARLNLAQLKVTNGDFEAAKGLLEQVLAQQSNHYPAMLELASLAGRKGDVKLQASWLEKAVAAQPALTGPRRALALLYLNTQQPLKALETAQPALEADPNSVDFLGIVGQSELQAGKTEESIKTFQRLVNVAPQTVEAYFLLARAYGLAEKHREMQAALTKALEIDPNHLPSQVALVRFFVLDGQSGEAEKRLQALKKAHPDNAEVMAQEGWMRLREGKAEEAAKSLQQALDRAGPAANRELVESLAEAYWGARQWEASLGVRDSWLKNNPNDIPMLLSLGQNYTQLNRPDDALKSYRAVQAVMPDNVIALNNLAWLLQKSAPEEALGYAEQANRLVPGTPSIMDTLGWLLLQQGQAERARDLFEEASQKSSGNPQYRYHLAQALDQIGESKRAEQILQELLADQRLKAEHPKIQRMLEQIQN